MDYEINFDNYPDEKVEKYKSKFVLTEEIRKRVELVDGFNYSLDIRLIKELCEKHSTGLKDFIISKRENIRYMETDIKIEYIKIKNNMKYIKKFSITSLEKEEKKSYSIIYSIINEISE